MPFVREDMLLGAALPIIWAFVREDDTMPEIADLIDHAGTQDHTEVGMASLTSSKICSWALGHDGPQHGFCHGGPDMDHGDRPCGVHHCFAHQELNVKQ